MTFPTLKAFLDAFYPDEPEPETQPAPYRRPPTVFVDFSEPLTPEVLERIAQAVSADGPRNGVPRRNHSVRG